MELREWPLLDAIGFISLTNGFKWRGGGVANPNVWKFFPTTTYT